MIKSIFTSIALVIAINPLSAQAPGFARALDHGSFVPHEVHHVEVHTTSQMGHGELHNSGSSVHGELGHSGSLYSPQQIQAHASGNQHVSSSTPHSEPTISGTYTQNRVGGGSGGGRGGSSGGNYGGGRGSSRTEQFNQAAKGSGISRVEPRSAQLKPKPSSSSIAENSSKLPVKWDADYSASQRLGHKNVTAKGRTISDHAAQQMTTPPKGRAPMNATEVDHVLDKGQIVKADRNHPQGATLTVQNKAMQGRPKVVVDEATGKRIVTVIKGKS